MNAYLATWLRSQMRARYAPERPFQILWDWWLELRIWRTYRLLQNATAAHMPADDRMTLLLRLADLHAQRRPEYVARIERKRGLR